MREEHNYAAIYFNQDLEEKILNSSKWHTISLAKFKSTLRHVTTGIYLRYLATRPDEKNKFERGTEQISVKINQFIDACMAEIKMMFEDWSRRNADEMMGMDFGWDIQDQLYAGSYGLITRLFLSNPLNVRKIEEKYELPLTGDPNRLMSWSSIETPVRT